MTIERTMPYWFDVMVPQIRTGKRLLVVAHGNSLRGLVKYLDDMDDKSITRLNIPTGIPLVYTLDENFRPIESRYLGDADKVAQRAEAVANQAKS
jgi:2,3-bisphosphoglycerate-dependent phosphoglycerate mutase